MVFDLVIPAVITFIIIVLLLVATVYFQRQTTKLKEIRVQEEISKLINISQKAGKKNETRKHED